MKYPRQGILLNKTKKEALPNGAPLEKLFSEIFYRAGDKLIMAQCHSYRKTLRAMQALICPPMSAS
ncbi:hypothetical protein [Gluconobacter morbifer]|uniref:hypothetical protein n=1 Tax=Gluconobacter morbifer TaxID=479935 RepID=UPI001112C78C|nr:hypothetical protein [Gluconobacter morbifer]